MEGIDELVMEMKWGTMKYNDYIYSQKTTD